MVYDNMDYTLEADTFANQQKYVKPLLPYEIFVANLEAGNDKQLMIKALVESLDLTIGPTKALGTICAVSSLEESRGETVYLYPDEMTRHADEIIRVSGNSMSPTFEDGDRVLVHHQDRLKEGEIGIFVNGDAGYIKEYRRDGLYSHNPDYAPIRFSENDSVRCVGRVLGKLRPEQRASAEDVEAYLQYRMA